MTANEAYLKIISERPGIKAINCFEYASLFVFTVVTENTKIKDHNKLIDRMRSVNKITGEIRDFKPFHISIDEYREGKEIANYK